MTANVCPPSLPTQALYTVTAADRDAMAQFESALDTCVQGWYRGDTVVLLQSNIQEFFGEMPMQYLKQSLIQQVGYPVTFTSSNSSNGGHTIVQMPENKNAHLHFHSTTNPTSEPSPAPSRSRSTSTNVKKTPRPRNCWIIFRDAMHKKLKAENPHLTVQQISTQCSQMWHGLSPTEKKPWQAAAKSVKEEHLRVHPDYKYSPRKPGEKKKRQSRKAKQAPTFSTDPSLFDLLPVPQLTTAAQVDSQSATIRELSPPPTYEAPIDFSASFVGDVAQLMEPPTLLSMNMDDLTSLDSLHDSESLRHDQLEAEFGVDFEGTMPFDLFGEESFAFRAGADGNATLPSIYSELY